MRFGSVCSGIEAASVAWHPLGWEAAWLSEIEPFPCAVLKHHYPDVPNHGDMTLLPDRILSGEVEAPDLFCGGTPCQAFSVAGLRNSLDDARGNLSLTFVGIANAIDHVRSVRRDAPAVIFWENVPGVLNTKDNAFGCFLGALAGETEPIRPPGGGESKWSNAGCVFGPQRTVAWRVLDAQYFGVAQRRRRVFVVASARDDFNPAEVLFEFEGLRRDIAPSRKTGQEVAGTIAARFGISRNNHEECVAMATWPLEVAPTLTADFGDKLGQNNQHIDSQKGGMFVQSQVFENHPADSRVKEMGEVCSTVVSRWGTGGGNLPMVSQPIAFEPGKMKRLGYGDAEPGLAPSLRAQAGDNQLAIAHPIPFQETADCLTSAYGTKWNGNASATNGSLFAAHPMAFNIAPGKGELKDDIHVTDAHVSKTIDASGSNPAMHQGGAAIVQTKAHSHAVAQPVGTDCFNGNITGDIACTMGTMGSSVNASGPTVMQAMAVRRLTPVECERLQGFPDGYTNIPWRKASEAPDGPRYKALGNSWAVPVVRWIGQRIQERITT